MDDQSVAQRVLDHIANGTTDIGQEVWREPVANYRSKERLALEIERILRRSPVPFCPSAALPEAPPQNAVLSPMVGTAYVAPEPGSPPFVTVGSKVAKGDTLLIIEAMKVMNALHAQRAGTVVQIFVSDGMPVEFGQPLMVIE